MRVHPIRSVSHMFMGGPYVGEAVKLALFAYGRGQIKTIASHGQMHSHIDLKTHKCRSAIVTRCVSMCLQTIFSCTNHAYTQ